MWIFRSMLAVILTVFVGVGNAQAGGASAEAICATQRVDYQGTFFDTGYSPFPAASYLTVREFQSPWVTPTYHGGSCGTMAVYGAKTNYALGPYGAFKVWYRVGLGANDPNCYGFYPETTIEAWSNKFADSSHPEWWLKVASQTVVGGCTDWRSVVFNFPMECDDEHCYVPNRGDQYNIVIKTYSSYTGAGMAPQSSIVLDAWPGDSIPGSPL